MKYGSEKIVIWGVCFTLFHNDCLTGISKAIIAIDVEYPIGATTLENEEEDILKRIFDAET